MSVRVIPRPCSPRLWPRGVSPRGAVALQRRLAGRIVKRGSPQRVRWVAGADISWDSQGRGFAVWKLFRWPGLQCVETRTTVGKAAFPYIPGLLSFRETPLLLKAFKKLSRRPDLIFVDGHGFAHFRRFGVASHLGWILDIPAIGCAKSRLLGEHADPPPAAGAWTPLRDGGERIGAVLRTRSGAAPIYVSMGHRVGLLPAIRWTLAVCDGTRLPVPTREADRASKHLRKKRIGEWEDS